MAATGVFSLANFRAEQLKLMPGLTQLSDVLNDAPKLDHIASRGCDRMRQLSSRPSKKRLARTVSCRHLMRRNLSFLARRHRHDTYDRFP